MDNDAARAAADSITRRSQPKQTVLGLMPLTFLPRAPVGGGVIPRALRERCQFNGGEHGQSPMLAFTALSSKPWVFRQRSHCRQEQLRHADHG